MLQSNQELLGGIHQSDLIAIDRGFVKKMKKNGHLSSDLLPPPSIYCKYEERVLCVDSVTHLHYMVP